MDVEKNRAFFFFFYGLWDSKEMLFVLIKMGFRIFKSGIGNIFLIEKGSLVYEDLFFGGFLLDFGVIVYWFWGERRGCLREC